MIMNRLIPLAAGLLLVAAPGSRQGDGFVPGEPALYYVKVGSGDPPIVVVHGGPGVTHDYLRPEWDRLASNHQIVYYDQRGCGRSGRADDYNWRAHVSDLGRVIDYVSPGGRVILAGSSWGSLLALLYAAEHQQRVAALVLSAPPPWPAQRTSLDNWPPELRARLDSFLAGHRAGKVVDRIVFPPHLPPDAPAELRDRLSKRCEGVFHATNMGLKDVPDRKVLSSVNVPVLILRGAKARSIDGSVELSESLPNAQLRSIPDSGHDPWFEQPDTFFAAVSGFLAELEQIDR